MLTMTVNCKEIETDGQHYDRNNDSRDDVNYIRHYLILYRMRCKEVWKVKISQSAWVLLCFIVRKQQSAVFEVVESTSFLRDVMPLGFVQSLCLFSAFPEVVGEGLPEMRIREVNDYLVPSLRLFTLFYPLLWPFASHQLHEVEPVWDVESPVSAVFAPVARGLRDEAKVDDLCSVHLLLLWFVSREVDSLLRWDGFADVDGLLPEEDFFTLTALLLLFRQKLFDHLILALSGSVFWCSMLFQFDLGSHFTPRNWFAFALFNDVY